MPVKFRVSLDGQPLGAAHGIDVDEQGNGTVTEQRLYQLIRQPQPIVDRQFHGKTRAGNLVHLCRHHHRLKHMTRWTVKAAYRAPGSRVEWSSPTGHTQAQQPPPF